MEFKIEDKIKIIGGNEYESKFKRHFGIIKSIYKNRLGILLNNNINPRSKDGLYYFYSTSVEHREWGNISKDTMLEIVKKRKDTTPAYVFNTDYDVDIIKSQIDKSKQCFKTCDEGEVKFRQNYECQWIGEGELKNMKTKNIVELWYNTILKDTQTKNGERNEELFNSDKNLIAINEKFEKAENLIREIMIKNNIIGLYENKEVYNKNIYAYNLLITKETSKALDELNIEAQKNIKEIEDRYFEVKTMLSACETYEQEIAILKAYNIIDNDGKLVV